MSTSVTPSALLQMLCFVRVVEAGSFAEAGRRLGMTTSGVSKTIARFERTHGVRLLHRSTHSQSLTAEGESLLEAARETLRSVERLEGALATAARGEAKTRVRLSAPTAFVRCCLVPLLPAFLAEHADIGVELRGSDAPDDLALQGVDLAIRTGPIEGVPGLVSVRLLDFAWVACATPTFLKHHGAPASPEELGGGGLIGFRNGGTGRLQPWRFKAEHAGAEPIRVMPDGRIVADDAMSAWEMARLDQGIAWAPYWLAAADLRSGRIVEILREWRAAPSPLTLLRRDRQVPRRTQSVISFLRASVGSWSEPRDETAQRTTRTARLDGRPARR